LGCEIRDIKGAQLVLSTSRAPASLEPQARARPDRSLCRIELGLNRLASWQKMRSSKQSTAWLLASWCTLSFFLSHLWLYCWLEHHAEDQRELVLNCGWPKGKYTTIFSAHMHYIYQGSSSKAWAWLASFWVSSSSARFAVEPILNQAYIEPNSSSSRASSFFDSPRHSSCCQNCLEKTQAHRRCWTVSSSWSQKGQCSGWEEATFCKPVCFVLLCVL
jgi:hypothetical protein